MTNLKLITFLSSIAADAIRLMNNFFIISYYIILLYYNKILGNQALHLGNHISDIGCQMDNQYHKNTCPSLACITDTDPSCYCPCVFRSL